MIKVNTIIQFQSPSNYPNRNDYYSGCQFKKMKGNKNNKNIFKKMKENVGISKPKKHRNKIGMVP